MQDILSTPCCHAAFKLTPDEWRCAACDHAFPVTLGIPDLRWPRPTDALSNEKVVTELVKHYPSATFRELATLEMELLTPPDKLGEIYLEYRLDSFNRGRRIEHMFRTVLSEHFVIPGRAWAIDLGCGVGANMVSMVEDFDYVCGIDPFLPDLLLARKFFEEQHINNGLLVQATAQRMPFADSLFDYASCQNVIEHLIDVRGAFREISRVLKSGGCFCGDSRNRFDLLMPEPHVQLRWVGFFPRRLMPWYVRLFRNTEYKSAHLLSLVELSRYLRDAFGSKYRVVFPHVCAYGHPRSIDRILKWVQKMPMLHTLALFFFSSHLALAQVT